MDFSRSNSAAEDDGTGIGRQEKGRDRMEGDERYDMMEIYESKDIS
jgi:hypothetical protein